LCTSLDVDKFSISGNEIFSRSQLKLSSVTIKGDVPVQKRKIITYRSYTNFDTDSFNCDLEKISFPDIENLSTSSEVHNVYNEYILF
jgi:hypothetical protein